MRGFPVWARYGLTTLLVAVFVGLKAALGADMTASPYLLFVPAIILCSFGFDRGTGFYATALSAAFATAQTPRTVVSGLSLAVFVLIGLFCAIIIEALRITVEELAEYEEQLERDLALRRQAEIALSESEARFRATFEHAAAGVALVGLDGRWLRVNRRLCDKLGYSEDEMLRLTFQDITHPDDLDADLSNVQELLAGKTSAYNMEKRYVRKDGSLIWILLTVALVRGPDGAPQYFISVVQDISARKAAESVLSRDRAELEQLVEERTAALMRAAEDRRRAEDALRQGEKLQALGQLTGGIAHDFNNFLQVVGGGADLLLSPRLPEARRRDIIQGIAKAAQNAADLTGRLLAFARKQSLRPEVFDVNARLRDMHGLLRHTLNPNIELVLDLAEEAWPVRVDPQQLEVAVVNLAVNARDAMATTGGTLTLTTRNGVAGTGTGSGMAGHVDLIVRDTGEGMPPSVLARVFEPFFTTKGPDRGTGLGLAQVHGFIKQSGGEIVIDSAVGEGTTVTLRLPRAPDTAVMSAAPERAVEQMIGVAAGRRVLAVDDNADVAAFAISMLQELGYETDQASHAEEALRKLERGERFDAIFSDIVMPGGMNGLDLATVVRDRYPDVAVVLASGYSDALVTYEGPRLWEILTKPYRLDELGAALERALGRTPRLRRAPPT